jgi:hypothetical protein
MGAGTLLAKCQTLKNAETMLLIHNCQIQVSEPNTFLDQRMGPNEKFCLAADSF